jgi:hypothetical protein
MIRKGFKEWADAGFPRRGDGTPRMDTTRRGYDDWLQIPWEEALTIAAGAIRNVAETYTGDEGAAKLLDQGYEPAMVEAMHGAGVQAIKMRGGMPLLGSGACSLLPLREHARPPRRSRPERRRRTSSAAARSTTTRGTPISRPAIRW